MRYVIVPEPVILYNLDTEEPLTETGAAGEKLDRPWSMRRFLSVIILPNQKAMPQGMKGAMTASRIRSLFRDVRPTDVVPVESADWEAIKKVIETPDTVWNQALLGQMTCFMAAWLDAKEEPPTSPKAEAPQND